MTKVFSFRPAPLRGVTDWQLSGHTLTGPNGDCDLTTVIALRWADRHYGDSHFTELEMTSADQTTQIALNIGAKADANDPDRTTHLALCTSIVQILAAQNPDIPVRLGTRKGAQWAMFLVGLISIATAFGLVIAMVATGVTSERMTAVAVPVLFLLALGFFVVQANKPWRSLPSVSVKHFQTVLMKSDDKA
ncbi:MAG: hypothetical protein ACRBB0_23985 [Pelagimonas sp.]|uniref:hypothetical protein n=1 Tax=Pelagimonas sp. TaxID=2073170 RepID=UPI003D6BC4E9